MPMKMPWRALALFPLVAAACHADAPASPISRSAPLACKSPIDGGGVVLITPNLDDDDGDRVPDAADARLNGKIDLDDATHIYFEGPEVDLSITIEGPGAGIYRILEDRRIGPMTGIRVEAAAPRGATSRATIVASAPGERRVEVPIDVRPFVLTGSFAPASQVIVMDGPTTRSFVKELEGALAGTGVPIFTVPPIVGNERDVWVQDAIEIGSFLGSTMRASLKGLRAGNTLDKGGPLDDRMADLLFRPGGAVLSIGTSRITDDWIDQFGNLEILPPHTSPGGKSYTYGRILTASQGSLRMHADVLAFLEHQGVQWPPLYLDASFVLVGHVDELVSVIPTTDGLGYRVLVASPARGLALLEDLVKKGRGDLPFLEGKRKPSPTASSMLADAKLVAQNREAEARMQANRKILMAEVGIRAEMIIELPVLFEQRMGGGMALWPNVVNGLVIGRRYIAPKPFGPRVDGVDVIEEAVRQALKGSYDTEVRFVDNFAAYSDMGGEVHCGTNALRRPHGAATMQLERLP